MIKSISLLELPANRAFPSSADMTEAVSFKYLAEDTALAVLTAGGDIALFRLADEDSTEAVEREDPFVPVS
jgi:hypothetical protein